MLKLPDYIGPCAFGIKMGIVTPDSDLQSMILSDIMKLDSDGILHGSDVLAITESVVARSQNNFVSDEDVATSVRERLALTPQSRVGIVFPIMSRNRFSLILQGIAKAVPEGEVVVQLSYPDDEVGNQVIPPETAAKLVKKYGDVIRAEDVEGDNVHPMTGVNYIDLYTEIIRDTGATPRIYLSNDPTHIGDSHPDGVIVADIHTRKQTQESVERVVENCCTLQDICNGDTLPSSEWGLLGSNMSSEGRLKLAPYLADVFARTLQEKIYQQTAKEVGIIVYGDGAYRDPSTGIYELADPVTTFGATDGFSNMTRSGFKMKYLIDLYHAQGKSEDEIMSLLEEEGERLREIHCIESQGTTPRCMTDILASLSDLISGSADAGTPMILIRGIHQA